VIDDNYLPVESIRRATHKGDDTAVPQFTTLGFVPRCAAAAAAAVVSAREQPGLVLTRTAAVSIANIPAFSSRQQLVVAPCAAPDQATDGSH